MAERSMAARWALRVRGITAVFGDLFVGGVMPLRSPDHPLKGPPGILIVEAGPTLHGRPPACAVASPRAMTLAG